MRVSIVGAGYVGLVTGACLAEAGHDVQVVDLDPAKVDAVNAATSPIRETGLQELLERQVGTRLHATTDLEAAVVSTDVSLVAVGTPSGADGIDLGAVVAAAEAIGNAIARKGGYHAVIVKSTVVPGTTAEVILPALERTSGRSVGGDLGLGMNPEFLTEGRAVADFTAPDRLVLGADDERTHALLIELYESVDASVPRLLTNTRTAETIKYASNALLATMISFANEIGDLCAELEGVDVVDVMRGVHVSDYLSPMGPHGTRVEAPITSFLEAGCGFGGSCLPKDLRALVAEGARRNQSMPLLRAVLETNEGRSGEVVRILESGVGDLDGRRVTVLGVAFKPDTDDVRESPAVPIVEKLVARGAVVTLHDPAVRSLPSDLERLGVEFDADLESSLAEVEAVVLVTRWAEYQAVPELLAGREPTPVLLDGRRMLQRDGIAGYLGIGVD